MQGQDNCGSGDRAKALLISLTIALSPQPVLAADKTAVQIYADVFTITALAEAKCPGVRANDAEVSRLKHTLKISDADKPRVAEEEDAYAKQMAHMVVESSLSIWCDKAWDLLGPRGTMMKNALKRTNF